MILRIVQAGDPVLRQRARPLQPNEIKTRRIRRLIAMMRSTMRDTPGVGLAAPQVGRSLQLIVIEDRKDYFGKLRPELVAERERTEIAFHVLINPRVIEKRGETKEFLEACLSVTGYQALVPRALEVTVEAFDHRGVWRSISARGWYARILQHEIDHLRGRLYIDRMRSRSLMDNRSFDRRWREASTGSIYEAFGLRSVAGPRGAKESRERATSAGEVVKLIEQMNEETRRVVAGTQDDEIRKSALAAIERRYRKLLDDMYPQG